MFLPPLLRPIAAAGPTDPAVQRIADAPLSLIRGVPGSYVAELLAGAIDSWRRLPDCVWLRVADARPAGLTESVTAACRHRWTADAEATGTETHRLEATLDAAPEGAVVVIELGGRWTAGVGRLLRGVRPVVTDRRVTVVVVSESRFRTTLASGPEQVVQATQLLDPRVLEELLPGGDQLLRYAGSRVAVLHDVHAAAELWSVDAVTEALRSSFGLSSFLDRLTSILVAELTPAQRDALRVAATTGYWHPQLGTSPVPAEQLRPWLVPLERQWGWLRPLWAPSLRKELAAPGRPAPGPVTLDRNVVPAQPRCRTAARGRLEARLLGPFEVRVDGAEVTRWRGQRGVSVLRFLLARRQHACTRDELLEEFWPEVEASSARNRLQVAVSGLRRAFGEVTTLHVVEYADGCYRVTPELEVDVDVESFERSIRAGAAAERAGDREAARAAYRTAVTLYRGDLAVDAPFEGWTLVPRESLRLRLVDALDRLSRIELADRRVEDCITTAQRMLDLDPCREDAHRLLMHLYAVQGRAYLALRQFEFCRRVLRATIDAAPAPETTSLYEAIRSGATRFS